MTTTLSPRSSRLASRQRGVSLMFALLALVSLSLAAVALVRSVDTSALVMGNLGFKQDATASADKAAEAAIVALSDGTTITDLNANDETHGYYAMAHESIDATGQQTSNPSRELINWDMDACAYASNAALATCLVRPSTEVEHNGNKMRYVIFRLCSATGAPDAAGNSCARPAPVVSGGSGSSSGSSNTAYARNDLRYGGSKRFFKNSSSTTGTYQGVYYRIVVRVVGARNTTSFVETIVHL